MTPLNRISSPSLLPARMQDGESLRAQRYILARILEERPAQLSAPAWDDLGIAARLERLPAMERAQLADRAGGAFHHLTLLAEESNPEFFYEALFNAGRRAENEDRFEVAQRCYLFLARWDGQGHPVPPRLQGQARERLEILAGGGSTWNRIEFVLRRLPAQSLDPAFLVGMGSAALAARGLRLGLWARSARFGGPHPRFFPRLFQAGLTATAESLFFLGAERGTATLLGEERRAASAPEAWLSYAWPMFLATRFAGTTASRLYRRRLPEGARAGLSFRHRLGYGLAIQSSIFGAASLTQNLESAATGAERRPRDAVAQALVWTLAFGVFHGAAGRIGRLPR